MITLSEVFSLFVPGMVVGAFLSAIPFIIGYVFSFFVDLMKGK